MNRYSLSHLSDHELLEGLRELVSQDNATTAAIVAHLAEADARNLKPSMPGIETPISSAEPVPAPAGGPDPNTPIEVGPPGAGEQITPLPDGRYQLDLVVDQAFLDDLDYLRDLLGDELPSGDTGELVERALDALVEELEEQLVRERGHEGPIPDMSGH